MKGILFAATVTSVLTGCAAACPVIKVADEVCPEVTVIFADGTQGKFACKDLGLAAKRLMEERGQK